MISHRLSDGVIQVDFPYSSPELFGESAFLMSDLHWDSVACDRDMLRRHLDECVERDGGIFIFGDLFDAMQGPKDPRGSKGGTRPELAQSDAYFNDLVEQCAAWFGPYIPYIKVVGHGNHETSAIKHYGVDLIRGFTEKINEAGGDAHVLGYEGWVLFRFERQSENSTGHRRTQKMYFNHGSGGSSPVTRGVIKASRRAAYLPDADIVVAGHIHESWQLAVPRLRLTDAGRWYEDEQLHLQMAAYTHDRDEKGLSWPVTKEFSPKPKGAWRVDFAVRGVEPVATAVRLH